MSLDYVRTARAKGVPRRKVIFKHAFRNALIPVVSVVAIDIGGLFGGLIITEKIFSIQGMGQHVHRRAHSPATPRCWWSGCSSPRPSSSLFNLIADIAYGFLDPRVRLT